MLTEKTKMMQELGDKELLLPGMINEALRANERIKYFFTLLQTAKGRADDPDAQVRSMKSEREASGIDDAKLDDVVEQSSRDENGYVVPQILEIEKRIFSDIDTLVEPLPDHEEFGRRKKELVDHTPPVGDHRVSGEFIQYLTSVRDEGDSLHALVMDAHRELNRLQAAIYQDSIDGAMVYGLGDESDRLLVRAFMRGLNRTSRLKFDHPGLGTTATRAGESLIIQNDVGTTEAHVLVVRVDGLQAVLTYADVHVERLAFFQSTLGQFGVSWNETTSRVGKQLEEGNYFLAVGTFRAKDRPQLEEYLSYLGSRIVFLIDWNRARKSLRGFVKKRDAIELLRWAAESDIGHEAFVKMGGESIVADAIERTPRAQLRYGEKLADVLGRRSATEFLRFVLKTCEEGMLEGRSETLIKEEIRAELAEHFQSIHEELFEVARDHAEVVVEISSTARDAVLHLGGSESEFFASAANRTKRWEKVADDLLNKVRQIVKRTGELKEMERIVSIADDAADCFEESVFLLSLTAHGHGESGFYERLRELAELSNKASMEFLKVVEGARLVRKAGRQDLDDFLAAVDMTRTLEHQADDAYRSARASLLSEAKDFRQLYLFDEITSNLEEGTDAVTKAAIILRDFALEEVVSG
jgi:uncharacterized protein Yka (UPF0111/DUF47 family)